MAVGGMISEKDIYATAKKLIDLHGPDGAAFHAAQKADEMLAQGATAGMRTWQRILAAIEELSPKAPPADRTKH